MEQQKASQSASWNWDGEITNDEWFVYIPKNCHRSLLYLHVGKDRILPKTPELLDTLFGMVEGYTTAAGMKSRVSEALQIDGGTRCKKDLANAILKIVDERMSVLCRSKAAAVHRLFRARLTSKGNFPYDDLASEANMPIRDLVRLESAALATPQDGRSSSRNRAKGGRIDLVRLDKPVAYLLNHIGFPGSEAQVPLPDGVARKWKARHSIFIGTTLCGLVLLAGGAYTYDRHHSPVGFLGRPELESHHQVPAPSISRAEPILLYLQPPTSEYVRSWNRILREYLRRQMENVGDLNIKVLERDPSLELDKKSAESILTASHARSIMWLSTAELPPGKRLYLSELKPNDTLKSIDVESTLSNNDLRSFTPVDQQVRAVYALLLAPVFDQLTDRSKIQEIISKSYQIDPILKQRGAFDLYEAENLAEQRNFFGALDKLRHIKIAHQDKWPDAGYLGDPKFLRDYHLAVVLYRLGRYEDAYSIIAKGRVKGSKLKLSIWGPVLAYSSNGIIFLKLDYPEDIVTMVSHNSQTLLIFESPYTTDFDEALNKNDADQFLAGMTLNLTRYMHLKIKPGLYFAKPDHQIVEGEYFALQPKWVRPSLQPQTY